MKKKKLKKNPLNYHIFPRKKTVTLMKFLYQIYLNLCLHLEQFCATLHSRVRSWKTLFEFVFWILIVQFSGSVGFRRMQETCSECQWLDNCSRGSRWQV